MKIRNFVTIMALLAALLGCGSDTIEYRELNTSGTRNLELCINPQAVNRSVTQINYTVTGLSLQLSSAEPTWITNFYWQAGTDGTIYTLNAQNPGPYTLQITHHGINGTEPISVTESFSFELVPMTITRLVIVPGQIGIIDVATTAVDATNTNGTYTNDTTLTNTTGTYTNETTTTNTTGTYTNETTATNTTGTYTNETTTTNTTGTYTNETTTTNYTGTYTNETTTTNYTGTYTNETTTTNYTGTYTNETTTTNYTGTYTNETATTNYTGTYTNETSQTNG